MERRSFLFGALAGLVGGGAAGGFAAWQRLQGSRPIDLTARTSTPADDHAGAGSAGAASGPCRMEHGAYASFAQQGEDLIIARVIEHFKITQPSFIDIGAHDPIANNNTYVFYAHGSRGVLVEPNPFYAAKLRKERPLDKVVEAGIGVSDQTEADYYVIRGDGQLNTFSKEQADEIVKRDGPEALEKVVKMPLLNVNHVLAESFAVGSGAPDIFSVDTEGLDYDILKSLDFKRFRPLVICAETSQTDDGEPSEKILKLLADQDYVVRGGTFVNTVFVDHRRLVAGRDGG